MDESKKDLAEKVYKDFKKEYKGIERIEIEGYGVLCIYAPDDTLWKIFEDNMGILSSIEFEAGVNEPPYIRIII